MLARQAEVLEETLQELRTVVDDVTHRIVEGREQREKLLEDHWRSQRASKTLERLEADYETLQAECQALNQQRTELRERLQHVLSLTRTLASEYGP